MNHQSNNLSRTTAIKVQFLAEVELGMPSKKCRNFGICRVYPLGRFQKEQMFLNPDVEGDVNCKCRNNLLCNRKCKCQIEGILTVLENDRVEICFLRGAVKPSDFRKYFMSGSFLVEEDYTFSNAGVPDSDFTIKKGIYPVVMNKTLIKVLFMN